jgi:hypothetical protein
VDGGSGSVSCSAGCGANFTNYTFCARRYLANSVSFGRGRFANSISCGGSYFANSIAYAVIRATRQLRASAHPCVVVLREKSHPGSLRSVRSRLRSAPSLDMMECMTATL